ncbi:Beta-Casp domain-containing protein [Aphelenchoides fujianensis]|nr:Beta-Casp domain-containing protein [Aphelenchoides fujianensis]
MKSETKLTCLGSDHYRPCYLLRYPKATILLDHAVNLDPMATVLPAQLAKELFDVKPSEIDAVLVSHWSSFFSSPVPHRTPRVPRRRLLHTADQGVGRSDDAGARRLLQPPFRPAVRRARHDRKTDVWQRFKARTYGDPSKWRPMFTAQEIERCLSRVVITSMGEEKIVNGATKCTAYSSGWAIGSCNWVIEYENTRFGYLSAGSIKYSHMKNPHWKPLRNLDSLLLTSLSRTPNVDPMHHCHLIGSVVVNTLRKGGNVLFPINPVGCVFDLIETICSAITVSGEISRDFRTPCVVLTGHPTMRIGNVVHFMELWAGDEKNAIICTDPDYPMVDMYKPFRNFLMRAYEYPLETRLDAPFVNETLLPDLSPKHLILPEVYTIPGGPHPVNYPKATPIRCGHTIPVSFAAAGRKRALVDGEMLKGIRLDVKRPRMTSMCNLRGFLSTYDNKYEVVGKPIVEKAALPAPSHNYVGSLSSERLISALKENGIAAEHGPSSAGQCTSVRIPTLQAEIRIAAGGRNSRICCPSAEVRHKIQKILCGCLE